MRKKVIVRVLRLTLFCLAMSVVAFLFTSPSSSSSSSASSSNPRPRGGGGDGGGGGAGGGGEEMRDPYPWEVDDGIINDDITEFRGVRRNLQTALVKDDIFTQPANHLSDSVSLSSTKPSLSPTQKSRKRRKNKHSHQQRSKYNYTAVQQVRQRTMDTGCRDQSITRETWTDLTLQQRSLIAERMMVNEEHQLLYCPVPLTAITPWMKVFYLLGPGNELSGLDLVPSSELSQRKNFVYLSSFSPEEQEAKINTYLKFMVTRHPFFRLAAAYKMKFESENAFFHERYGREIIKLFRPGTTGEETGSDVKFSEFIEYVLQLKDHREMNEHWQSLDYLCLPCQVDYNYILHYETLSSDVSELLRETGLMKRVPSLPLDVWDQISTQYMQSLFQQITPAWIGQLVQHYNNDFNTLSYGSIL